MVGLPTIFTLEDAFNQLRLQVVDPVITLQILNARLARRQLIALCEGGEVPRAFWDKAKVAFGSPWVVGVFRHSGEQVPGPWHVMEPPAAAPPPIEAAPPIEADGAKRTRRRAAPKRDAVTAKINKQFPLTDPKAREQLDAMKTARQIKDIARKIGHEGSIDLLRRALGLKH
jgi:hypothetical protein